MDSTAPLPTEKRRFFNELEAARGVGALFVAGVHCAQAPTAVGTAEVMLKDIPDAHWFWRFLHDLFQVIVYNTGDLHHALLFFFILSGFVLTDSIARGPHSLGSAAGRFFLSRFFRIYPAIVATIMIFWVTHAVAGLALSPAAYTPGSILRNLALLDVNIDGVMWTIQAEVLALPVIFVAALLATRFGLLPVAMMTLMFTILSFIGHWVRLGPIGPPRLAWFHIFLAGVLAYYLGRKFVPRMGRPLAVCAFLGSVLVFFLAGYVVHRQWGTIFRTLAGCLMIAVVAFAPPIGLSAPLRWRPLRFLGRVSYSFYLLHPLALMIIWHQPHLFGGWLARGVPAMLIIVFLWLATTLTILPLAWLVYRAVELPGIELGKRIWRITSN